VVVSWNGRASERRPTASAVHASGGAGVPAGGRPAELADADRLKSSGAIHRREFVTRDRWRGEWPASMHATMAGI
jgi:hypothetical protein